MQDTGESSVMLFGFRITEEWFYLFTSVDIP